MNNNVIITGFLLISCGGNNVPFPGLTRLEIYNIGVQAMQDEKWEDADEAFENILLTSGFEFAPVQIFAPKKLMSLSYPEKYDAVTSMN